MDTSKVSNSLICSKCGGSILTPSESTNTKLCECWKKYTEDATKHFTTNMGWICPACGNVNGPAALTCVHCGPPLKITV